MSQSKFSVHPELADPLPANIMTLPLSTPEGLSALADDELEDEEVAALLAACEQDEAALGCWCRYQLIGEVLRSPVQAWSGTALDAELDFVSRLGQRLAQEAVAPPLAPAAPAPEPESESRLTAAQFQQRGPASNDGNFRWKLVASVTSLAAVSLIAWNVAELAPASAPQLAQAPFSSVLVVSPQGPMLRDPRLQELLAAHKQFGATSALQEPSGFLRNATFEMPPEMDGGH